MIDDDEAPVSSEYEGAAPEADLPPRRSRSRSRSRSDREARAHAPRTPRTPRAPRLPVSRSARRRRFTIALVALVALAVIVAALAYAVWSTLYRTEAAVAAGRKVTIVIAKGSSADQVASVLARAGVVRNATMFRLRASALEAAGDMKPGTYVLTTGSAYDGIIRLLEAGPQIEYVTFTIPEGWGIPAIAERVEDKFGIPASTFTKLATTGAKKFTYGFLADNPTPSLEGYLFPKTYTLKKTATATDVIDVMLTQYGKEIAPLDHVYAKSKGVDPHEALTIASIIEREAVLDKDRPKVASVIYNRLAIGMRLQVDSTVQYALNGKAKLNLDDLKTQSPYNTYMNVGVPPGPICSPGLSSIQAALKPAKTNYIYYILTHKDGSHSFAVTYAEFLVLKAQSKRGLK